MMTKDEDSGNGQPFKGKVKEVKDWEKRNDYRW